jgi:hypothetical protein
MKQVPIKRRVVKARVDVIDFRMESQLRSGMYLTPFGGEFEDDEHRREMWVKYRDKLLPKAAPGRRPHAFWCFDRSWPEGSETEEGAVHRLEDTSAEERREIEKNWQHSVRVSVAHGKSEADARRRAADFHGVPSWFFDRVRAEKGR